MNRRKPPPEVEVPIVPSPPDGPGGASRAQIEAVGTPMYTINIINCAPTDGQDDQ